MSRRTGRLIDSESGQEVARQETADQTAARLQIDPVERLLEIGTHGVDCPFCQKEGVVSGLNYALMNGETLRSIRKLTQEEREETLPCPKCFGTTMVPVEASMAMECMRTVLPYTHARKKPVDDMARGEKLVRVNRSGSVRENHIRAYVEGSIEDVVVSNGSESGGYVQEDQEPPPRIPGIPDNLYASAKGRVPDEVVAEHHREYLEDTEDADQDAIFRKLGLSAPPG